MSRNNQRARDPKFIAFKQAGGDNRPPVEYLLFLDHMKQRFVEYRGACGCKVPPAPGEFTQFVVEQVQQGFRVEDYEKELTA